MDERTPTCPSATYADEDLERWDAVGSSCSPFAERLQAAQRARLLRLAIGPSYGDAVERGLAWFDAQAALLLAATPAVDRAQNEAKGLSLRDHAFADDDVLGAMIRAALSHDEARVRLRDAIPRDPRSASGLG